MSDLDLFLILFHSRVLREPRSSGVVFFLFSIALVLYSALVPFGGRKCNGGFFRRPSN